MIAYTEYYEPVMTRRTHTGLCPVCGKKRTRTRRFEHTINPFNRDQDGNPKGYDQVRADVRAEADAWQPDFTCQRCKRTPLMWKEPDVLSVSGVVAAMMAMIVAVISMAAGDLPRLRDSSLAVLMGLIVIIISKTEKDMEGKC